jgi:single-strand DNA-binding protein
MPAYSTWHPTEGRITPMASADHCATRRLVDPRGDLLRGNPIVSTLLGVFGGPSVLSFEGGLTAVGASIPGPARPSPPRLRGPIPRGRAERVAPTPLQPWAIDLAARSSGFLLSYQIGRIPRPGPMIPFILKKTPLLTLRIGPDGPVRQLDPSYRSCQPLLEPDSRRAGTECAGRVRLILWDRWDFLVLGSFYSCRSGGNVLTFPWGTTVYYSTGANPTGATKPTADALARGVTACGLGTRRWRGFEGRVEAMADLNKVFLIGRLVSDPVLRRTSNGTAVTDLGIATTRSWPGPDGDRREETLFIDVTVWDRQAENCCQFLRKGRTVHVEGFLRKDSWEDKNTGEKRSKIRLIADRVQFLDPRSADSGGGMSGGGGMDDELAPSPPPARDASMRRSGPAPARGPGGGYGEPRSPINGPGRAPYPPPSGPVGPPPMDDEREEDDIPF